MSFSSRIKEKLCGVEYTCSGCAVYETEGAIGFGGLVTNTEIRFATEKAFVAERVQKNILAAFGIDTGVISSSRIMRICINNINQVENIADGISHKGGIPFSCCRSSFVRGAFLGGGSVTDPQKEYHMEFNTKNKRNAELLQQTLEYDGFSSKITQRKGYNVVYIKGSEEIADILGYMGAPQGAFALYSVQIEKDMRNTINRRVNCENANTNKAAKASSKHLYAIRQIKEAKLWDKLPEVLKEICSLREEYPEDSLKELGERTNPPIGKSGVNHRLNRILEIAKNI